MPPGGEAPAFGDARVRDLLRKGGACGLKPKSDTELLPVLLELIGARIPVSRWPAQMAKAERTGHAREAAQAQAAHSDRSAQPPDPETGTRRPQADDWLFSPETRYCPRCLAGDGSPFKRNSADAGNWPGSS
jgi:hypothetical protein